MRIRRLRFRSWAGRHGAAAGLVLGITLGLALASQPLPAQARSLTGAPSPETTEAERLARSLGRAETTLVNWVLDHSGPVNGNTFAGEYRIAYTITPAEAWWDNAGDGALAWHDAPANNLHLRIFVLDRYDGRLVPNLRLRVMLTDTRGNRHPAAVDYGWYPLVNAYGGNIAIDTDGTYTLSVAIDSDPELSLRSPHAASLEAAPEEQISRITVARFAPIAISREEVSHLPLATTSAAAVEYDMLRPFNDALSAAISAWWKHSAAGKEKPSGDYFVAYALNDSAGLGTRLKNLLAFSGKDEARLSVLVRDSRSGRILPGLDPKALLVEADSGRKTDASNDPAELQPAWHPWLTPYASQVRMRGADRYQLRVWAAAPGFRRWGRESGRFGSPVEIEFNDVSLSGSSGAAKTSPSGSSKP
jgi:hypothetical protein